MLGRTVTLPNAFLCTAFCVFGGCATPTHTNALIFGTNTKVALDISSGSTGTMGLTLGFSRQEAVFMPLMANRYDQESGKLVPAECPSKVTAQPVEETAGQTPSPQNPSDCPSLFMGKQGEIRRDAYSVLASFGGELAGTSEQPRLDAKGFVRSYFATGVAAQTLAAVGGAALVSTANTPPTEATLAAMSSSLSPQQIAVLKAESVNAANEITELVSQLYKDGKQAELLKTWLGREPAASLGKQTQDLLTRKIENRAKFEEYLMHSDRSIARKLKQASMN